MTSGWTPPKTCWWPYRGRKRKPSLPSSRCALTPLSTTSPTSVFHVHLRDMYTGGPHPAAPTPAVLTIQPKGIQMSYNIVVSGDYLGIYVLSADGINNEVVIWNWKRGVCKLVSPRLIGGVDAKH